MRMLRKFPARFQTFVARNHRIVKSTMICLPAKDRPKNKLKRCDGRQSHFEQRLRNHNANSGKETSASQKERIKMEFGDQMVETDGASFEEVMAEVISKSGSHDTNAVRLAAVGAALMEGAAETQAGDSSPSSQNASPSKVYAAAVAALEGTLTSSTQSASTLITSQIPLLEIMRLAIPFVSPALFTATFPVLNRILKAVVASADSSPVDPKMASGGTTANALLRQVCRTSTWAIQFGASNSSASGNERKMREHVLHLLRGTILPLFDDKRAKVRRAAHGAALEILKNMQTTQGGNSFIADYIVEYACEIISSTLAATKKKRKKPQEEELYKQMIQTIHLLHFLESAMPILSPKLRIKAGQDVIKLVLMATVGSSGSEAAAANWSPNHQQQRILLANAALSAILVTVEESNDEHTTTAPTDDQNRLMNEFASRVLASLLSNNGGRPSLTTKASSGDSSMTAVNAVTGGDCKILYSHIITAVCVRLISSKDNDTRDRGFKLLPLSVTAVLNNIVDDHSKTVSEAVVTACASDLSRIIRSCFPTFIANSQSDAIQGCIDTINRLQIDHRFRSTWQATLQPLATLLVSTKENVIDHETGLSFVRNPINGLVHLRSEVNDDQSRKAIEEAVVTVVQGIGLESFWGLVSLTQDDQTSKGGEQKAPTNGGISMDRAWLLPILKSASASHHRTHLSFFQTQVLGLARECDTLSAGGTLTTVESAMQKTRVAELWSLFPAFCGHPSDVELIFPALAQTLVKAMGDVRYPQLVPNICNGLVTLSTGVLQRNSNFSEMSSEDSSDEKTEAETDAKIIGQVTVKLLPALFKIVETLQGTSANKNTEEAMDVEDEASGSANANTRNPQEAHWVEAVTEAIAELARLSPPPFLQNLFKKIVQRLLASQGAEGSPEETEKLCTLLGLAQALVSSETLDEQSVSLLYRAIRPLIRTDEHESRVQKRAYKVMAEVCERYTSFVTSPTRLDEMTELIVGSLMTCQVAARHMRLKCMTYIIKGMDRSNTQQMEVIPKIMGEVLLCLKDSNGKTREAAYQLLLAMAEVRDDMTDFFQIILAALGAQTPHMRSAAVMALSRLVFEYARTDDTVQALLPSLLETVVVLFDENSREVIKSVVAFVRVSVAALSPDQLEPLLPAVVEGLMKYNKGKDRFRAKIKIILKKLVRTYGYEKITPLVPEGDARLLTHMRKLAERAARRKAAEKEAGHEDGEDGFDDLMDSDEEDSDGGRTLMTGVTGFTRMTGRTGKSTRTAAMERSERGSVMQSLAKSAKTARTGPTAPRIRAEKNGEIMDMLDSSMAKNVHFGDDDANDEFSDDDDGGVMEFDEQGRLVINDEFDEPERTEKQSQDIDDENAELHRGGKRQRLSKFESAKVSREEATGQKPKKNTKSKGPKALGAAYKSKKAGGDVQKKGQKYEPYAYVPLDGKSYTKKNRSNAISQMSTVVRDKGGKRKR